MPVANPEAPTPLPDQPPPIGCTPMTHEQQIEYCECEIGRMHLQLVEAHQLAEITAKTTKAFIRALHDEHAAALTVLLDKERELRAEFDRARAEHERRVRHLSNESSDHVLRLDQLRLMHQREQRENARATSKLVRLGYWFNPGINKWCSSRKSKQGRK